MAKLIKKGTSEILDSSTEHEFTQISEARRAPIIDRDTYEARAAAQQIRERAQTQADEIVAQAEAQTRQLLEQAAMEAEQIKADAQIQGYQEGRETGVAELTEIIARAGLRQHELENQLVPQLSTLATHIARKILGRELEFDPEAIVHIVKQTLGEKARQRREITLRVHPLDAAMIREHKAELVEMLSRTKEIAIREDPDVDRHGVIIETDAGSIDAQLDTQLAVFERVLNEIHEHAAPPAAPVN